MAPGDLILTPSWTYHDHGSEIGDPVIWLDGLDIPILQFLDAGFCENLAEDQQQVARPAGDALARYGANMLPVDYKPRVLTSPVFVYPYERTREALDRGIRAVKPGRRINVIGRVIESYAARFGYGVVREFTGHGIGTAFHSGLIVPHYDDPAYDDLIEVGMTFTIEPMLNLGTHEWDMWDDGWTVVTKDRRRSAQFEHTVLVTPDGAEVLTTS